VVTGNKFPQLAAESPQRVTVIDSATVAHAADLSQLLNEQAGIVVNGAYSNPGKDRSIFLRNGANQYTLILVDGQPVIDPSSLGGPVDLRLLSLQGVERIEILRGARSLLYGSDAVGGVINIITARSTSPDPFRLHLRAAAQRYDTYEGSAAVSGRTKKLDYRLGYDYFTSAGISEAEEPENSPVAFDKDGVKRQNFMGSLTYRPTEELTIRPTLRRAIFDGDYDAGAFQDADNTYTSELWLPSLSVDYVKGNFALAGRYNYVATDREFDSNFGESKFEGRAQQGDIFARFRTSQSLDITVGSQLRYEKLDTLSTTTVSPYLLLNFRLAERYLFEAGYRFNHHSEFGGQSNWSLAAGTSITPVWSVRLSAANAFQSPTLDQLAGPFGANAELQPQVSTSFEAGTQVQSESGRAGVSVAVFQREVEDLIVYDNTLGYQNRNELRDRGVEVEGRIALLTSLSVNGNFTYVKGRLREDDGQGGTNESDEFYRRPRVTGLLGFTYSGVESPFTARISGNYTGRRPDIYFNADFASFETELDPFLIVNVYAEYKLGRTQQLTVFGEVRNLTDADFTEVTGYGVLGVTPRIGVDWVW
jgi:vitamin B12 transporter